MKIWLNEVNRSLKEYVNTGKFLIGEGYKLDHSDDWFGGFYSLVIFILLMIVILPFFIILDIIKIPLYIFGKFIIWIYKNKQVKVEEVLQIGVDKE